MRLMTYNAFEGAQDTFPGVLETVYANSPDLLIINEANGFDRDGKLEALENVGLQHHYLEQCGDGDSYHVAILSRVPFSEQIQTIHPLDRAGILAVLKLQAIGSTAFVGTHLTPFSETKRKREMDRILAALVQNPSAAIAGDLNALSPQDSYSDDTYETLTPSQRKKFGSKGAVSFKTIQEVLDAGFVDAAVLMDSQNIHTVPTESNADPDHASLRLDYIFVRGALIKAVSDYRVIINKTTDESSDHYPVIVDLSCEL